MARYGSPRAWFAPEVVKVEGLLRSRSKRPRDRRANGQARRCYSLHRCNSRMRYARSRSIAWTSARLNTAS